MIDANQPFMANTLLTFAVSIKYLNQNNMKTNVGAVDGAFRTLLFIISLVFAIMTGQWLWVIPGAILFATSVLTWCPLYAMLGVHTNETGVAR